MDPALQIDPERCVLVLGSQLAAGALALSEGVPAALSYAMVVEIGMQRMLEVEGVEKMEEKARKQTLMLSAYELEPAFAASKVVDSLRQHGVYQKWLEELFGSLLSLPVHRNQGGVVDMLNTLKEKGALLVYTYYDTILDAALNTSPVFLNDEMAVRGWATHRTPGLLHVHGAYSQPDSMKCDCVNYRQLVGEASGSQVLREVCRNRCVVFLGFDGEFFDPFLFKFSRAFLGSSQTPPLLLSLAPKLPSLENFLTLRIPQLANLEKIFITSSPVSRLGPTDSMENKISTTLLYSNKSSCKDAAERVKVTSGINVHQLTMRHEHLYHQLLLYLDKDGLKELWKILFMSGSQDYGAAPSSPIGLHMGLLGIMFDRTVVWLNRAAALGKVTVSPLPSPMEAMKGLQDAPSLSSGHPRSGHTPSLTTNVSVISSMWTPIASPSVSKSISTYTRPPTLPSPLISSTSRTSLGGVATRGPHGSTLSPHHLHARTQVRRVQSEKDHLTYQDRLAKQAQIQRRINGVLHHTESAPEITGPSDVVVPGPYAKLPRPVSADMKRGMTMNQVYPLARDGSQLEVKIECVDQSMTSSYNPATAALISASQNAAALNAAAQRDYQGLSAELRSSVPALSPKGFAEERRKFISEAQSWSKQVDSELAKKKNEGTPQIMGGSSHGDTSKEQLSLGIFASRVSQPSLSSKFSLEEQEKLLRQHFEFQQQQQQQLQVTRGASHLNPVATSSKLPHIPLSISTAHPSHTHSSYAPSKVSPHHPIPSPSKSPLGQYHTSSAAAAAPSLFPFLTQAAASLVNPAANFVCNPSISQYQAALLNPLYQVAMQQLLSSQIQGGNAMLAASGPSILQSLVDKVPIFLPDGSITFIPTSSTAQGSATAMEAPAGVGGKDTSADRGPVKSPDGASSGRKRTRSPEASDIRGSPPKRRRSSSLPDITQLPPQLPPQTPPLKEAIKEEDDVGVAMGIPMVPEEPRLRQLAPPTMIHIPQDMKLGDPMIGFPTPPQSSPLVGNFALSPIVLSSGGFQPMTPVTPNQEHFGPEELQELVEAGGAQTPLPPSPEGSILPPFPAGRGPIQLWQFLLDLLLTPEKKHLIDWTGNGYEFRILQPEEIAKLWGARKNKPRMNYDKLSRGLRYYYSKGIMDKVQGKKLTFKYTCDVQNYVRSRQQSQNSGGSRGGGGGGMVKYTRTGSASSEGLVVMPNDGRGIDGRGIDGLQHSPQQQQQQLLEEGNTEDGDARQDQSEKSFSDLDLMASIQSAVKNASEGLSNMVGVVSQGFVNPLQGGGLRTEGNQLASAGGEVGICTEAV